MASWNARIDDHQGRGPKVVTIHGQTYHTTSPADPPPGLRRQFGQLYILDSQQALHERLSHPANVHLQEEVVQILQNELDRCNPLAREYKNLGTILQQERQRAAENNTQLPEVRMIISRRQGQDRRYDDPTAAEIAAVYVADDGAPPNPEDRDIIIYPVGTELTIHLNALSPNADPMTYPLFFPFAERGWGPDLRQCEAEGRPIGKRISLCQYYAFRIAYRDDSIIHHGGLLFQQYIVDGWTKVEGNNLNWLRHNQQHLRSETYQGLYDHLRTANPDADIGRVIILPSSFPGSPRNMYQNFQDAMSIVRVHGKPDIFLTFTANPKWQEITQSLLPGQTANDRPDIVSRVFYLKLHELKEDLLKRNVLGRITAHVYTIEFQKRGLPHAHMLLFFKDADKPRTPQDIDALVSAQIPDPQAQPVLYEKVKRHMIHGPCGNLNPACPCMKDNHCSKGFPKPLANETKFSVDGYPHYERHHRHTVFVRNHTLDDQNVVPYNAYLLAKYDCHINVEVCTTVKSVKYIFKYIHKGHDCASVEVRSGPINHDEIQDYLNARYVGPHESIFRLLEFRLHEMSHTIQRLAVHLPLRQNVYYHEGQEEQALQGNTGTTLTAWFELNARDPLAHQYLYHEIPEHYTFDRRNKTWKRRQRSNNIIGRMYQAQPSDQERFSLRLLLLHRRGAVSFDDLRTIDGVAYPTFKEAARAMGLLQDDNELQRCLMEASHVQMPKQMRQLFATLLLFCNPSDEMQLFLHFQEALSEDFVLADRQRLHDPAIVYAQRHMHLCLFHIGKELQERGASLAHYNLPRLPHNYRPPDHHENVIDIPNEQRQGQQMYQQLNQEQQHFVDTFLQALHTASRNNCFYIDGCGGTGKTFVYNTLVHILRGMEIKVKCVAFSGIASTLLIDGATAHSTFQIPIPLDNESTCNIKRGTVRAQDLSSTSVFIWDEASMIPADAINAVDRLMKDLLISQQPFGGKFFILGGDFRQVLPVIRRAGREITVSSSLKSSRLWSHFQQFHLLTNMRATQNEHYARFCQWLLRIGDGTEPFVDEQNNIMLPEEILLQSNTLQDLIRHVYPQGPNNDPDYMAKRCCLTPKNDDSHAINHMVLQQLPGETITYFSIDSIVTDDESEATAYPVEYLNSITPNGMPLHKLELKVGYIPPAPTFLFCFQSPLKFNNFNCLSYSNDTITILMFHSWPCLHSNQVVLPHSVKNIHCFSLDPFF